MKSNGTNYFKFGHVCANEAGKVLPLPHPMSESSWNGREWLGFTLVASVECLGE